MAMSALLAGCWAEVSVGLLACGGAVAIEDELVSSRDVDGCVEEACRDVGQCVAPNPVYGL